MNRKTTLDTLVKFFEDKGKVLTKDEYAACEDKPLDVRMVKRYWGSWNRVMAASARKMVVADVVVAKKPVVKVTSMANLEVDTDLDSE